MQSIGLLQRPFSQALRLDRRQQCLRAQPQLARRWSGQGRQVHFRSHFLQKRLQTKCDTLHTDYSFLRRIWSANYILRSFWE